MKRLSLPALALVLSTFPAVAEPACNAAGDPSFIELDWAFHGQICRMSSRKLLPQLLSSFTALLRGKPLSNRHLKPAPPH